MLHWSKNHISIFSCCQEKKNTEFSSGCWLSCEDVPVRQWELIDSEVRQYSRMSSGWKKKNRTQCVRPNKLLKFLSKQTITMLTTILIWFFFLIFYNFLIFHQYPLVGICLFLIWLYFGALCTLSFMSKCVYYCTKYTCLQWSVVMYAMCGGLVAVAHQLFAENDRKKK